MSKISAFLTGNRGATAIEYALLAALMALVVVVAMPLLGTTLSDRFMIVMHAFD